MNNPRQGWRYFQCEECKFAWRETCRDAETQSSSFCPKCHQVENPRRHEIDPYVAVDHHFNLIGEEKIEQCDPPLRRTHSLKIWPLYFAEVIAGRKTFEVRVNDRRYRCGDSIVLREWDPQNETYTGRQLRFDVGYVLPLDDWAEKVAFSLLQPPDERVEFSVHGTDGCLNCETGRITVYARHRWCVECLNRKGAEE